MTLSQQVARPCAAEWVKVELPVKSDNPTLPVEVIGDGKGPPTESGR